MNELIQALRGALQELVDTKEMQERVGKTDPAYIARRNAAWKRAVDVLVLPMELKIQVDPIGHMEPTRAIEVSTERAIAVHTKHFPGHHAFLAKKAGEWNQKGVDAFGRAMTEYFLEDTRDGKLIRIWTVVTHGRCATSMDREDREWDLGPHGVLLDAPLGPLCHFCKDTRFMHTQVGEYESATVACTHCASAQPVEHLGLAEGDGSPWSLPGLSVGPP